MQNGGKAGAIFYLLPATRAGILKVAQHLRALSDGEN